MIKRAFRRLIKPYLAEIKNNYSEQFYTCEMLDGRTRLTSTVDDSAFCEIKNGYGRVHLDFTVVAIKGYLGRLPFDCPTPKKNLEQQPSAGGNIWITAGQRTINCSGLQVGTRCIVDLTGIFAD